MVVLLKSVTEKVNAEKERDIKNEFVGYNKVKIGFEGCNVIVVMCIVQIDIIFTYKYVSGHVFITLRYRK